MVNTIYLLSFVETPRKFIIAELSIRKLGSSSVLIMRLFEFTRPFFIHKVSWYLPVSSQYMLYRFNVFSPGHYMFTYTLVTQGVLMTNNVNTFVTFCNIWCYVLFSVWSTGLISPQCFLYSVAQKHWVRGHVLTPVWRPERNQTGVISFYFMI